MPPKFSLQSVLDYRHSRVEMLEVELGRLLHVQQQAQTFLESLQDGRARILDQLGSSQQGDLDLFLISRLRSSLNTVNERITQQKVRLLELSQQVQVKRNEVVAARQKEETLAILKGKEIERFETEQAQQENRLQDVIYIAQAHGRAAHRRAVL
jgi:flagellar export protein FliJ